MRAELRLAPVMAHFSRNTTAPQSSKQTNRRDTSAAFDRLGAESAKAYQAFVLYRDLPIAERSLTTVSQRLAKSRSLCARWSSQFRWVERVDAWDEHQDQVRRQRIAAEREKIYERQLQHNRIASQALVLPMVDLLKRAQTSADALKKVSTAELMKLVALAAKALPGIHKDERQVAGAPDDSRKEQSPLTITSREFGWVQGRCTCEHLWDEHQVVPADQETLLGTACNAQGCRCKRFNDADEDL